MRLETGTQGNYTLTPWTEVLALPTGDLKGLLSPEDSV